MSRWQAFREYLRDHFEEFMLIVAEFLQIFAIIICWIKLPVWAAGSIMAMWYGLWLMISHIIRQNERKLNMLEDLVSRN